MKIFSALDFLEVVDILKRGEIVAIPTETVYGLAGAGTNVDAILKIFKSKERPYFDPLILHVPKSWLSIGELTRRGVIEGESISASDWSSVDLLLHNAMPGPLTVLLPKGRKIPSLVTSGSELVAVRSPDHDVTQRVLESLQLPLAAPSANLFGKISPTSTAHVEQSLKGKISFILQGGLCAKGIESTIVSVSGKNLIVHRKGSFSFANVSNYFNSITYQSTFKTTTPGNLESHYAPDKKIQKFSSQKITDQDFIIIPHRTEKDFSMFATANIYHLSLTNDENEAASNLFRVLHLLNQNESCNRIFYVDDTPKGFTWEAIIDRLSRASHTKM